MTTRERLLSGAIEVLAKRGIHRASTRSIAAAARVNEVTLFRLFGSKEALFAEALESHAKALSLPRLPAKVRNPRVEVTTWACQFHRSMRRSRALIRRILGEFDVHPEMRAWAEATFGEVQRDLDAYLRRLGGHRGLAVDGRYVKAAGEMLVSALTGSAVCLEIRSHHRLESEEAAEIHVSLFLRAIGLDV